MNRFLKLVVLAVTPLTAISVPYLRNQILSTPVSRDLEASINKQPIIRNTSKSIILINKKPSDLKVPCEQSLDVELLTQDSHQSFENSEKLLNYLLTEPKKLAFDNVRISFPQEISQKLLENLESDFQIEDKQQIGFQRDDDSLKEANKLFQALWKQWISNWNSETTEEKTVIFGEISSKSSPENGPKAEKLYKCHNGNWYSIQFNSKFDVEELETINFKNWLIHNLGIL